VRILRKIFALLRQTLKRPAAEVPSALKALERARQISMGQVSNCKFQTSLTHNKRWAEKSAICVAESKI
jgi:hypothetical protein